MCGAGSVSPEGGAGRGGGVVLPGSSLVGVVARSTSTAARNRLNSRWEGGLRNLQ